MLFRSLVEVKGGAIECRDGRWFQNERPMKTPPRDQAQRFVGILVKKLDAECAGKRPPILIVTAFPEAPFEQPPGHGDMKDAVLGQQDMAWLGDALEALVDRQLGPHARRIDDGGWIDALHRMWGETWIPRLSLGLRIQMRTNEMLPLDATQIAILGMLDHSSRLFVRGGPGTGKTLLARELCRRREPALYLCWTRALAASVRASGMENAWAVREYAAHLLGQAGVEIQGGAPAEVWTAETWSTVALAAAIDAVPRERAHRMLVIDEAQDFTDEDWELARALAGDGPWWAFGDGGQSFWPDRRVPAGLFGAELELKAAYRCPTALAALAERYRDGARDATPRIPEVRVVEIAEGETAIDRVGIEVAKALADGANAGDIAVVSLRGQTKSDVFRAQEIGGVRVVRADAPDAGDNVVGETFLRFKGLERPWVIVTELDAGERYDVRMYVALTRATVGVVVVGTRAEIEADGRLRGLG